MSDPDIDRAHRLSEQARHESVTPERLTQSKVGFRRYRVHQDTVYHRLHENEQPHFLFHADSETPVFSGPGAPPAVDRSRLHKVMHLITDTRWLIIAGNRSGDQEREVDLSAIQATNFDTSGLVISRLSNNVFSFETENAHFMVPLSNEYDQEDLEELSRYLRDEFGAIREGVAVDPNEAGYAVAGKDAIGYEAKDIRVRLDQLPEEALKEANRRIETADSVDELVNELDLLLDEYDEEPQSLDDAIVEASTVDELRQVVETPGERAQRRAKERVEGTIQTAKMADAEEVARYGLGFGKATIPFAVRGPWPATATVGTALAIGTAAGLHASGIEDSPLADIDPIELPHRVTAMANAGSNFEEIDGELAGALVGASQYLGAQLLPDDYAQLVLQAEPAAVMAGAEAGARFAVTNEESTRIGALAGAELGLLGGYLDGDSEEVLQGIVDEDLFDAYQTALSTRELEERG